MKIGEPAWVVVITSFAGAVGSAWRAEWLLAAIFGATTAAFAVASVAATRKR